MRCSTVLQLLNQEPLKVYRKPQLFTDWTTNLAKKRPAKQYIKQNRAKLLDRTAHPWSFQSCWTSTLRQVSFSLHTHIWETEKLPKDFQYTQITAIYKKKWERSDCNNYRGIALLTIAGKILATILLNRMVKDITDPNFSESQTIFRANRGTTDYVCSSSTPGEILGAVLPPLCCFLRPHQGIWHG